MSDTETTEAEAPETNADPVEVDAAAAAPAEAPAAEASAATVPDRAPASDLEGDLRLVLNDFVSGQLVLADGQKPTPHTLARAIAAKRGDGKVVSSGAVSAALNRWAEVGFITLDAKPMAFGDFTDAGRAKGLSALKAEHRAAKSQAKAATKAASAPAPAPAEASATPATEGDDSPPF